MDDHLQFPRYARHKDVVCFIEKHSLASVEPVPTGFPALQGAWKKFCPTCGGPTYYDLQPRANPLHKKT